MSEAFMMTQDIVEEHKNRMNHIRKYYPFFKITETSFSQYKEGKYARLDMGYITLAILRFFIEENNFKEKDVLYSEYVEFLKDLLKRDFELEPGEEESKELAAYIFDKIKNDGRPFSFSYYDPADRKQKIMRMKLLDSRMEDQQVYYSITADGVEFYLDTKEVQDQSTISVEQLLLEKMIQSRNFKGGTEVVQRINSEVRRLQSKKNEVLGILSHNVFEGMKACEEFMKTGTRWFEEEQKLFIKNNELIRLALEKARQDEQKGEFNSQYYRAMGEIYTLEEELKKAIHKHRELLQACMELQIKADELVSRAKLHALRSTVDFKKMTNQFMEQDSADKLACMVLPLLNLKRKKTFNLRMIDELLSYRPEREENGEVQIKGSEEEYIYEDEVEDQRIRRNFQGIFGELLSLLTQHGTITLREFGEHFQERHGTHALQNADYYTFFIHMGQKKEYGLQEMIDNTDTFFEEIAGEFIKRPENRQYNNSRIRLTMLADEQLEYNHEMQITNIRFELVWDKED